MRFNPRPTRGATSANNARAYTNVFQSTPPHEGRLTSRPAFVAVQCFNPRPHARGDLDIAIYSAIIFLFQSTPPREGRHLSV